MFYDLLRNEVFYRLKTCNCGSCNKHRYSKKENLNAYIEKVNYRLQF